MKKYLFLIFTLLTSLVATSCQDEDFGYKKEDISFHASVKKTFPVISPEQNWTTINKETVSFDINLPGDFTLKIYSCAPTADNNSVLLAEYDKIYTGMNANPYSVSLDCPAHLDSVYAAIEFTNRDGYIGKYASLTNNQSLHINFGEKAVATRGTVNATDVHVSTNGIEQFNRNFYTNRNDIFNTGDNNGSTKFYFISKGEEFQLIPLFIDENIKFNNTNKDITINLEYKATNDDNWTSTPIYKFTEDSRIDMEFECGHHYADRGTNYGALGGDYKCAYVGHSTTNLKNTNCDIIKIQLPEGYLFRFAFTQNAQKGNTEESGNWKYYSQPSGNYKFLGFKTGTNRKTSNDVILAFKDIFPQEAITEDPKYDTSEYFVLFEDLGSTADFDFNDVVLKVRKSSSGLIFKSYVFITELCAVGGTLPVYMPEQFDGVELHKVLGVEDYSNPINVNVKESIYNTIGHKSAETPTERNSSLLEYAKSITISVKKDENSEPYDIHWEGTNPRVLIISASNFVWPDENQPIYQKYPNFTKWVTDPGTKPDWWK